MLNPGMDSVEDQEALFHRTYPCSYYVQSPSSFSHANSADIRNTNIDSTFHSPVRSETFLPINPTNPNHEASRLNLSLFSSSRGSSNSFLHEKKVAYDSQSQGTGTDNGENRLITVEGGRVGDDDDEVEEDEVEYYGRKRGFWARYLSYRDSDSCAWIFLQISWRAIVSLGVAVLVFYLVTKPPPPKLSVKIAGIHEFILGQGADASGVATQILTCNCSIELVTDNKSKLFGLLIQPPIIEMSFGRIPVAISYGPKLYAKRGSTMHDQLSVGTRNKPMYGAGAKMQDMLESGMGLPLVIRMSLSSSFRVVWNLIRPKFHHQAECLLVLGRAYDKKHRTQAYNSSCTITS